MQEALELYEKENNDFDLYKDTALYPWQQELIKHINNKSEREVYWIVGEKTHEGKSYFQKYIKAMFGTSRVVTGINCKTGSKNICQSLRKYTLATADIFLFNLGKSKKDFENVNYGILEDLKYESTLAEQYNSKNLKRRRRKIVHSAVYLNTCLIIYLNACLNTCIYSSLILPFIFTLILSYCSP